MPSNNLRSPMLGKDRQASQAIIWLIGFFAFLSVYSIQAVLPLLIQEFDASPMQAGSTVGATVLAVALVSPFMGMLSDALGRKSILCVSLFCLTIPTALLPLSSSLNMVVTLRFVQGLFIPGIVVSLMAYIAEEFGAGIIARMTSVYVGGSVMGGFCGRFITGHAGHLLGWRGAFFTLAALNLIGAIFVAWLLPASRHFLPKANWRGAWHNLGLHLQNWPLLSACAVGFCVLFSLVGTFTYINLLLTGVPFNLSVAGLANVFCVYLVGVVITPFAGRPIVRYGFRSSLLIALCISTVGLLLTFSHSLIWVIVGLAVCSSGIFICQSATISYIARNINQGRSLATGIYYLAYYSGGAAGTWFVGMAYERSGWAGAVMSVILVQLTAAIIAWLGWKQPRDGASIG